MSGFDGRQIQTVHVVTCIQQVMFPRRSSNVCDLTAWTFFRNRVHGKRDRQRLVAVESKATPANDPPRSKLRGIS
jgi:hypothetical protein